MKHLAAFLAPARARAASDRPRAAGAGGCRPRQASALGGCPRGKRALWRRHQQAIARVDLSDDTLPPNFVKFRNWPSIHRLPDGMIMATTYATAGKDDVGCSIVSVRFTMAEIDALAARRAE